MYRKLLLIFVAYHPSSDEVSTLLDSLCCLPHDVGYALAINDYKANEPITRLISGADHCIINHKNLGYAKAINELVAALEYVPEYLAAVNTDLSWGKGEISKMLSWMDSNPDVGLLVPKIYNLMGNIQYLCKRNPTVLALFSRRFLPSYFKPTWLKKYDRWYTMREYDYDQIFDVEYLSGCFMLFRSLAFQKVSGFDSNYFLYLEDADITRSIALYSRCVHFPHASIVHNWGRGNYYKMRLVLVNIFSAFIYFRKWGLVLW